MASRSRHSASPYYLPPAKLAPFALHDGSCECGRCIPARFSWSLDGRDVYCSLRIAVDTERKERAQPRAVAGKRRSAPMGEPVAANTQLDVLSPCRLPNLRRWHGLVAVDDS